MRAAENASDARHLFAETTGRTRLLLVRNEEEQCSGDEEGDDGEGNDDFPPAGDGQRHFQGLRGGKGAEAAGCHHPAGQRRLPLGREPLDEGLERGHQASRDTQTDQRTADGQSAQRIGKRKDAGAGGSNQQQASFDTPRAITVEQHPQRQLGCAKSQKIGTGQQAQGVVGQLQFARDDRAEDGIDGAEQVGEEVAGGEGKEKPDPQAAGVLVCHGDSGFTWNHRWHGSLATPDG